MMKKLLLSLCVFCAIEMNSQTKFESLNYLYSIQGKQILSGQHNDQKNLDCFGGGATGARYWTDQVYSITGKYPALYSGDMLFNNDASARWEVTYEAERQWNAGAVVNIMWHSCPPTMGASCGWDPGIISSLSAQQFTQLLTEGTTLNNNWKARVDEISVFLLYLKNKGVEVFWRPYHEQNQSVFWWNSQGPENTKALWRMMHNYMTNVKGLDNLIWIWDVQDIGGRTNYWDWNPGNQYWDVLALDVYADAYWNSEYYNNLLTAAGNKPIAIGECFNLPSAQTINTYPMYTFFMNWSYGLKKGLSCENTNSDAFIREVYANPKVITREEMPGWGKNKAPNNLAAGKTVTVSSIEVGNNVAANVNDRNYGTRWSSLYTDNEWLAVDLNGTFLLDSVKIRWEAAYATAFNIQTSNNGSNWTTVKSVSNNNALSNIITLAKTEAKHIRIQGVTRATVFGYSIYELEVYGKAKPLPFKGTAISVPGTIQAEDYDLGGQDVAYYDLTAANNHGAYRTDAVDIETCTDNGGGFNIGGTQAGEWTQYSINVTEAGFYEIKTRLAAVSAGKTFHIEIDGVNVTGPLSVPNTGGWQIWQTVTSSPINLSAGHKNLRLVMDSELINVNYMEILAPVITNVTSLSSSNLKLFPNPSKGTFHFQLSDEFKNEALLEVISLYGQVIYSENINQNLGTVNLNQFNTGRYLVKISSATKVVSQSIILVD